MKNKLMIAGAVVLVIILALIVINSKKTPTITEPVVDNTVQAPENVNSIQEGGMSPEDLANEGINATSR